MIAAISLATLMAAALLWKFAGVAELFVLSLAVAAMVRPFVEGLEPRLGRTLALLVVYLSGLGLLGVFIYVASHGFLHEVDAAVERLGSAYAALRALPRGGGTLRRLLSNQLPEPEALYRAIASSRPAAALDAALGVTINALDVLEGALLALALSAYWSASHESFERLWLSLVPTPQRTRARSVWRGVERAVGAHLRDQFGQSAVAILVVAIAFRLVRLPTPILPALAIGVLRVVPFLGVVLAAGVGALAGASMGVAGAVLGGTGTLALLLALDRGAARGLFEVRRASPTLTVVSVILLVDAFGPIGLLLASTVAVAGQVYLERLVATHPRRARATRSLAQIEQRISRLKRRLPTLPDDEAVQLGSVVARLEALTTIVQHATAETRPS
jgi:predicted PurR-regulated permease PerM